MKQRYDTCSPAGRVKNNRCPNKHCWGLLRDYSWSCLSCVFASDASEIPFQTNTLPQQLTCLIWLFWNQRPGHGKLDTCITLAKHSSKTLWSWATFAERNKGAIYLVVESTCTLGPRDDVRKWYRLENMFDACHEWIGIFDSWDWTWGRLGEWAGIRGRLPLCWYSSFTSCVGKPNYTSHLAMRALKLTNC